ncbi:MULTISPECIES: hypothetical protein [Calothrix]|uniref:Uncharacterized protein n=2 Tax=Calothrix TaxID=1186 RepID=A0ABR8AEC8_9CYAN|nr:MULTISPECIES: hypothetical protein [Calothrix]MBD2198395.1 hypothetical protein [Calothrix parietina FACHB-288]MBD2226720.1 hypothetical protein [Calothrix anomala FACHB-343]
MRREALIVGINQYPFLKDTPTSEAKHLTTPATDAEAIALTTIQPSVFSTVYLSVSPIKLT